MLKEYPKLHDSLVYYHLKLPDFILTENDLITRYGSKFNCDLLDLLSDQFIQKLKKDYNLVAWFEVADVFSEPTSDFDILFRTPIYVVLRFPDKQQMLAYIMEYEPDIVTEIS